MKKAYFYIDDVIWIFRDLARQKPKSIFDHHFLATLKKAHDMYGLKAQLNVFYRTDFYYGMDEFTLAEMPDIYNSEWEANSDWLRLAFHSLQEFPDYPFINIDYDDMVKVFKLIEKEVIRFAGEKTFTYAINTHWLPVSKDGCRALKDCGAILLGASVGGREEYNGDPSTLPRDFLITARAKQAYLPVIPEMHPLQNPSAVTTTLHPKFRTLLSTTSATIPTRI